MKTLWFRYTYIVFVLSSKFRPRVIPMLYSFYLIVYLICISYYYYIILLYIPLFNIIISSSYVLLFFCMWVIYRIPFIIDSMLFFILCLFLVIISEIGIIVCDYIIIDISFILCVCFGFYDNIRDSFHILFLWWFFIIDYVIWIILDLW